MTHTTFRFDASASYDNEETAATLQVRWDWQDDGSWDTAWSTDKVAEYVYHTVGDYTARVEVLDSSLLSSTATVGVTVRHGSLLPLALHTQ